jgi:thiamine biosynthesis lipoprotein ApbE
MENVMSAAAWGPDSARLERALDAVRDSVARIERLLQGRGRITDVDSLRGEIRRRTGIALAIDDFAAGYALDRAALALAGVADSALLDLGGQFLWVGPPSHPTRRSVGIPDPENSLGALAAVEMWNGSLRTTSQAKGATRSVTVLAPLGLAASGWSTAFFALGCDSALALAPRLQRWKVSVVCADSAAIRWTADLEGRVLLPTAAAGRSAPAP